MGSRRHDVVLDKPVVAVQRPCVRGSVGRCLMFGDVVQQAGAPKEFVDSPLPWFDVWCTEHELIERVELDDDEGGVAAARAWACFLAAKHAREFHDSDVERDGWT